MAILFSKKSRLLIIGNSPWGKKVASVVEKDSYFSVTTIGARKFIQDNSFTLTLNSLDIVWICTTPELQLLVLKIIASTGGNTLVILEKPMIKNPSEHDLYRELGRQIPNLQISNPWSYSSMWQNFKEHIQYENSQIQIRGIRQGPTQRTYLRPDQDWLFHDVMLLGDLSRCMGFELEFSHIKTLNNSRTLRVKGAIGSKIDFDIEGGYAGNRLAEWVVHVGLGEVTMNFESNSARYSSRKSSLTEEFYEYHDNPLLTMLQTFITSLDANSCFDRDINQLKVLG